MITRFCVVKVSYKKEAFVYDCWANFDIHHLSKSIENFQYDAIYVIRNTIAF